jgi:hypothetical protein
MARPSNLHITRVAENLVYGPRAERYGHPRDNFTCIAALWDAYLIKRGVIPADSEGISARDVAMMFVLVKVARDAHVAAEDNLIDIAGYAETAHRLNERE